MRLSGNWTMDTSVPGLITLKFGEGSMVLELPKFPLEGSVAEPVGMPEASQEPWKDGQRVKLSYALSNCSAWITVDIRTRPDMPIARFRYTLTGNARFTGRDGDDPIFYAGLRSAYEALTEVQLSQFDRLLHSIAPLELSLDKDAVAARDLGGPILISHEASCVKLMAYEHGSCAPDTFLRFRTSRQNRVDVVSCKGNYYRGQSVEDFRAPWMEVGIANDLTELKRAYRSFVLEDMCDNPTTRTPFIFYNTWHHQEGLKFFTGQAYLKDMNDEFILRDIDIAHRLGIEVYVIDTGWYARTGDWDVNERFFPNNMKAIRERLWKHGMQLGLWFNPVAAAIHSKTLQEHPEHVREWEGKEVFLGQIWETEESYGMCLASGHSDAFIEKLIQLHDRLGVTYFKWDGIRQYGCDSPRHWHGTECNDPEERSNCSAYRMGLEMIRIAEEVGQRRPGTICDFDITERGRFTGLGFLGAGKYFYINNGPYFHNFDIPRTVKMEPDTINVFFYPGSARPQVCRRGTLFDEWIPSVLFLTHFLPHGDLVGQHNSMAALALGGNGIWGFLDSLSADDIARWHSFIKDYKRVRDAVTRAYPITVGALGTSPEIHEKLDPRTGRGIVACFTHMPAKVVHVTQPLKHQPASVEGADAWHALSGGRVYLEVDLAADEARTVFFF